MNVNTISLTIEKRESGHIGIQLETGTYKHTSLYLMRDEWRFALRFMRGLETFSPLFYDGLYFIRIGADGFMIYDDSSSGHKSVRENDSARFYYYFPLKNILTGLYIGANPAHPITSLDIDYWDILPAGYTLHWSNVECDRIREAYKPQPYWIYRDYEVGPYKWGIPESDREYIRVSDRLKVWSGYKGLQTCINHLEAIAANYSNGIAGNAAIHLSFDHIPHKIEDNQPDSFYFYILNSDGNRVINGGIIFHPEYANWETREYKRTESGAIVGEYSMHT